MNITYVVIVAIVAAAGYFLHEPLIGTKGILRGLVYSQPANSVENKNGGSDPVEVEPSDSSINKISFSLDKVKVEDFPEVCKIMKATSATIDGSSVELASGSEVKPLSLKGSNLKVKALDLGVECEIPVDATNFVSLTLPQTMARLNGEATSPAEKDIAMFEPQPEPDSIRQEVNEPVVSEPTVDTSPEEIADVGEPMATNGNDFDMTDGEPEPLDSSSEETTVDASSEAESRDEVTLENDNEVSTAVMSSVQATDDEIKAMVEKGYTSIEALKEAELKGFAVGAIEEFGGKMYQTAIGSFEADTLLGMRTLGVKALIYDGKIEKWIWAKSSQEIR